MAANQVPHYGPTRYGVFNTYNPRAGGFPSQLALTDAVIDGPFGHQLVHGDPEIDDFLRKELAKKDPAASFPNYIINPTPGLVFFPSASSSGWLVSGLPIETAAAINHPSAANKQWVRYGHYGFVERNDALYAAICPADLGGRKCVWDEVWAWDAKDRKWRGGCQMIRLCERLQYHPQPAPPSLTPYQYALHVDTAAHETLMTLHSGSNNKTLSLFNPTHPTSTRHAPHPLLGSVPQTDWPVLIPAPLPPSHEDHVLSCTSLHGIKRTCYAVRAERHALCSPTIRGGVCSYGHDLELARQGATGREKAHAVAAEQLVFSGQAVRVQRLKKSGRVEVWVHVPGSASPSGESGRFVIDGEADVRREWDLVHTVPWCRACKPPPLGMVVGADGRCFALERVQVQVQQEDEDQEAEEAEAEAPEWSGEYGYGYAYQHDPEDQSTRQPGHESMSWADSESTWQGDEVDEGLLKKWRETMGKNSSK